HRAQRDKIGMASLLDSIPGVGPKKRKALLNAFDNSIDRIRKASIEELTTVKGVNAQLAEVIKSVL
ncbi:MAG: excinuclease ABC subunit C, partial [Anaerolineae bacterium]|nr:excinuclease ABC subunit C [Anaerolineae bacterium]